jgi:cytochrome c oxidase subunit 1
MYVWTENRAGEGFFNLGFWNFVSTIGALILGVGALLFIFNIWASRKNPPAPIDPWDARSLEWMTDSPPKEHNFDRIPSINSLDEFFHRKYEDVGEDDQHDYKRVATGAEVIANEEAHTDAHIHMPSPSYWPIVLAFSVPVLAYGVIYSSLLIAAGAAIAIMAMFGWALEPPTADESEFDPPPPGDDKPSKEVAVSV